MNVSSIAARPAAVFAFDALAKDYDEIFTRSLIGRTQRNSVWEVLRQTFKSGDHVLEINCGTGEDALFLASNGVSVTACDASEQMIAMASRRLLEEAPQAEIRFRTLPSEQLSDLQPTVPFDGVLSNFSGLNCVEDVREVARQLAALVKPGAQALLCFSTRVCLWEMAWFALRSDFRRAFRRMRARTDATVGGQVVRVWYPTLRQLRAAFSSWFTLQSCVGIGVAVPPSYVEMWARQHPRMFRAMCAVDRHLKTLPLLRVCGDHMLLVFRRNHE